MRHIVDNEDVAKGWMLAIHMVFELLLVVFFMIFNSNLIV